MQNMQIHELRQKSLFIGYILNMLSEIYNALSAKTYPCFCWVNFTPALVLSVEFVYCICFSFHFVGHVLPVLKFTISVYLIGIFEFFKLLQQDCDQSFTTACHWYDKGLNTAGNLNKNKQNLCNAEQLVSCLIDITTPGPSLTSQYIYNVRITHHQLTMYP